MQSGKGIREGMLLAVVQSSKNYESNEDLTKVIVSSLPLFLGYPSVL